MWSCRQPAGVSLFRSVSPCTQPKRIIYKRIIFSNRESLCFISAKYVLRPGALLSRSCRLHALTNHASQRDQDVGCQIEAGGPGDTTEQSLLSILATESKLEAELLQLEGELMQVQLQASSQVDGAREQLQESRRKAELLEAIVIALRERLKREENRAAALEGAVEAGRVELARSEAERRQLQKRITGLRSELVEAQTKLATALRRASELETRVVKLAQQKAALALRVGELEEQMRDQTAVAGQAVEAARERMRALEAAADEDLLVVAKLEAQLADREAQLVILREGELELQEVLEQSKAAAGQLGEVLQARDAELQRLRDQLAETERQGSQEAQQLNQQLIALEAARSEEMARLREELWAASKKAEEVALAALEREKAHKAEVEDLRHQLQDAKLRAEQAAARRVAEVSELRSALDQQLGAARQEALDARSQLATVKEQLDGVLSEEFLQLLEEDLRRSVSSGFKSDSTAPAGRSTTTTTTSGSRSAAVLRTPHPQPQQQQQQQGEELRNLDSREAALRRQLESLSAELTDLHSGAVARLGPALVARAQELEAAAGRYRQVLRACQGVQDEQGAARASQQLEAVSSELGSLYRLVMSAEARDRERAVRGELQGRELELRGIMEKRAQILEQQQSQQPLQQVGGGPLASSASASQAQRLRQAVQARVRGLMREREQQLMQQAAAREQQLQAQLQARLAESRDAQQREIKAVQDTVAQQMRLMESSWKGQLEAFARSLQEAAAEKERLAVHAGSAAGQVRQQLAELETLRRELAGAQKAVAALRRAAESSQASAAQQSAAASQEVKKLKTQVQQLQSTLNERERQYAVSTAAAAAAAAAAAPPPSLQHSPQPTSPTHGSPPSSAATSPKSMFSSFAPPSPERTAKQTTSQQFNQQTGQQVKWQEQQQQQQEWKREPQFHTLSKISAATAVIASNSGESIATPDRHPLSQLPPPPPAPAGESPLPSSESPTAEAAALPVPLTPIRPDWPAQFGGVAPQVASSRSVDGSMAAAAVADVGNNSKAGEGPGSNKASLTEITTTSATATSTVAATVAAEAMEKPMIGELRVAAPGKTTLADPEPSGAILEGNGSICSRHESVLGQPDERSNNSNLSEIGSRDGVGHGDDDSSVLSVWSRILTSLTQIDTTALPAMAAEAAAAVAVMAADSAAVAAANAGAIVQSGEADNDTGISAVVSHRVSSGASQSGSDVLTPSPAIGTEVFDATAAAEPVLAAVEDEGPADLSRATTPHLINMTRSDSDFSAADAAADRAAPLEATFSSTSVATAVAEVPLEKSNMQFADLQQLQPQAQVSQQPQQSDIAREQIKSSSKAASVGPLPPPSPPQQEQQQQPSGSVSRSSSPNASVKKSTPSAPSAIFPPASRQQQQPPSSSRSPSPAAAAMAAAAGAAAAAKRAAALDATSRETAGKAPSRFNAPPISEWGRPKAPSEDVLGDSSNGASPPDSTAGGPSQPSASVSGRGGPYAGTTTFFSEAELGAEIAAIAQSLVQRTIGGGGAAAAAAAAATRPPTAPPAPLPARSASSSASSVDEASSSGPVGLSGGPPLRKLTMVATAQSVSAPGKGSEDAYFMLTPASGLVTSTGGGGDGRAAAAAAVLSALGVADGVGGWVEANVDPGQYSREVMDAAARAAEESGTGADPRQLLARAQDAVRTIGSCTACVAVLGDKAPAAADKAAGGNAPGTASGGEQVLTIANLGDSGCRVVRRGSLILATSVQEHQFNMPYQMAHPDNLPDTDTAADAQIYQISLLPGDVLVLATDGLFDNMWDEELISMVAAAAAAVPPGLAGPAAAAAAQPAAQQLAASLLAAAFRHAQDPGFRSPWAVELANQSAAPWLTRLFPRGGRLDDITVVVAFVVEGSAAGRAP